MPPANPRLTKFLKKYSTENVVGTRRLYNQWRVVEIRDTGKARATARCPCGRTGLRYICVIRNRYTHSETYVGARCAEHFHKTAPRLLRTLEIVSMRGVAAKFLGQRKGYLLFQIKSGSKLVRNMSLMRRFFNSLPYGYKRGYWELRVRYGRKARLRQNKWYTIKVDGATTKSKGRTNLHFYLSKVQR